jgi:di/tricarboxylate transporter
MTERIHHLPAFFVGMVALAVFALAGIVRDADIGGGVSWTLLLFMGGLFSLANVIQEYRITDWLAGYFVPVARELTASLLVFLVVMALAMYVVRFLDPSGFIAIAVLFLPVVEVTGAAGIPPLITVAPLVLAAAPFWLAYENIWIAMGEGITAGEAFTAGQRIRAAHVYAAAVLVTLVLSVGYWKLIGTL